jgi:outer membrane protein OmpA-like peptidoglycan-associated protein
MYSLRRVLIFLTVFAATVHHATAQQQQDKEQSKLYMEQAELILADTKAMDDARDIMVTAANFDTTNIKANFEAGRMHILTINKDFAIKFFLRIYHQDPAFRFDLEYWIGKAYHFGLDFNNAIKYYSLYRDKLIRKPTYAGKDKVDLKEVERNIDECNNGKELVAHPKNFSIVNIGSEINSEFDDYGPVLSENGNEIVFTTRRRDGNTNENVADDNKPYEDVFTATRPGGAWSRAKNIGPVINTKFNNSNLSMSPDGNTLFLYNDDGNGDIYFSLRSRDGLWGVPEPLPGLINSTYKESSISITKDGNKLYFASERPGGYGGSDIYVCTRDSKGEWTRVKNLGTTINTGYDEDGPFIDYDGKTLYFSSKGRKGMGGFDIFKSTLLDPERNEWSEPENLGYPINTPDNDIYFVSTPDGKKAYYSSTREDGFGYDDIYVITVSDEPKKAPVVAAKDLEPIKKEDPPKKEEPKKEAPRKEAPKKVEPFKYIVNVVDAGSQSPLEAKVRLQGFKDNVMAGIVNQGNGVYEFSIASTGPKDYRLSAERTGYVFVNETVKIDGAPGKSKTRTIRLRKLVVGVSSVLRNIYFDFSMSVLKKESYSELSKLEGMMKQNDGIRVEISGHTDSYGSKHKNKQLSLRRADAVRSYLTSKGIDPRRVTSVGYGEDKPLASNDDEKEGRELNRRVEFKVLGN